MKNYLLSLFTLMIMMSSGVFAQDSNDIVSKKLVDSLTIAPSLQFVDELDSLLLQSMESTETMYLDTTLSDLFTQTAHIKDSEYISMMDKIDEHSPFSLDYNTRVRQSINYYLKNGKKGANIIMGRSELFFPMMEEILYENGLPIEFKYLSIIESALRPKARSRAGAVGLWQFMYGTAKENGLKIDSYVDERMDPIKSTEAACKYLNRLYKIYGDWNLVLAAYNSGPGNVNKAIRRSGGKRDYWEIRDHLPRETRGYVPNFIAANFVFNYHEKLNVLPVKQSYKYALVDTVAVNKTVTFDQLHTYLNISIEDLEYLNPSYYKNVIPVSDKSAYITIPASTIGLFIANEENIYKTATKTSSSSKPAYASSSSSNKKQYYYKVRSGDVLGTIAQRNGVSVRDLRAWNNIRGNRIYAGQKLMIRSNKGNMSTAQAPKKASIPSVKTTNRSDGKIYHTIRKGDTLWDIAKLYPGVSVNQIKTRNSHLNFKNLKLGSKVLISG